MDYVERLFWSLAIFFGVHFLWLGFAEPYVPVIFGTAVATVGGLFFFFGGFRQFSNERE